MINETAQVITELTAEQISNLLQERVLGLIFSLVLIGIGSFFGIRVREKAGKIVGAIFAMLGAAGVIYYVSLLLRLSKLM